SAAPNELVVQSTQLETRPERHACISSIDSENAASASPPRAGAAKPPKVAASAPASSPAGTSATTLASASLPYQPAPGSTSGAAHAARAPPASDWYATKAR